MDTKKRSGKKLLIWAGVLAVLAIAVVYGTWHISGFILDRAEGTKTKWWKKTHFSNDGYYEIYDAQDYEEFWNDILNVDKTAKGRLCSDIYLNDTSNLADWHRVPPQNRSEGVYCFYGSLDGNGYTIYGLYSEEGYGITYENWGCIENITIKDSLILGKNESSGICTWNEGMIRNCSFQGEVETVRANSGKVNMVSGFCTHNIGSLINCEFAGEIICPEKEPQMIMKAGICMENYGEITGCYNLTRLKEEDSKTIRRAISDGGERNCYMREDSGWEASGNGQILALDYRQCLAIDSFLQNGLYEYYFPGEAGLFALEKIETKTPVNIPMRDAMRDEHVNELIWEMAFRSGSSFSDLTFEVQETEEQDGFDLDVYYRDEMVRIVKTLREGGKIASNEELWQKSTEILNEKSIDSFEHATYRLYDRRDEVEDEERLMLYCNGQETGFFYVEGEALYQVVSPKTQGEKELFGDTVQKMMQLAGIQSVSAEQEGDLAADSLWETAFFHVVGTKPMDDGIDWKEYEIRKLIYDSLGGSEDFHTQEEIRNLTDLTVRMSKLENVKSLKDLEYLTGLKILSIRGGSDEKNSILQSMWRDIDTSAFPDLTELDMMECGLTDISFVEALPQLTEISFYGNAIQDISPLTACENLKVLSLAYNEISDITPLSRLTKLEEVGLQYNEITDIEVLCKLKKLTGVNLTANHVSDLSPLSEMRGLTGLGLAVNEISDISPLSNLTNIYNLSLDANQIQDISPLSDMKEMEWLGLSWNLIEDFSPIQGMEKLFFLSVTDNPSQDIGDLILTPGLSIGTWYTDRSEEMEELKPLFNSAFPGQDIEIEDFAAGDINGDGINDVAITGYSGEVRGEDGSISQWGERNVYLFLGTAQETYVYRDKVGVLGPEQGGVYGDPYEGIAIAGGKLVVKCYGGSNFRWGDTNIYEWETGGLTLTYELLLDNWVGGTGGYDWYVMDMKAGTEQMYAIAGTREGNMERLLLRDSADREESSARQLAIDEEIAILKDKLGEDAVVPDIGTYFYEPEVGRSYYDYEVHNGLYHTARTTDRVLDEAAARYLPGAVGLKIPIYADWHIKDNYDSLAGVKLPDCFYLGEKYGVPYLLIYKGCDVTEEGNYVHVCTLRKGHDDWWSEAGTIYYYEDTDRFEIMK